jgi:excinuclease UvrABC nuclease subunit
VRRAYVVSRHALLQDKARYFSPYPNVRTVRHLLDWM